MESNNVIVAKTSKRFLAFFIDMLLIGCTMQLLMYIFKGPYENLFHLEELKNNYYEIGQNMGIFTPSNAVVSGVTSALQDQFINATKDIVDKINRNNLYLGMINGSIASTIFQFIVPLCVGQGRSVGKLLTKLRVVKKDGSKIGFKEILLRGFVGMTLIEFVISIPLMFVPFTISACLVFASNSKRALHDIIAGTICTYVDGYQPQVYAKESKKSVDPYHKNLNGFEYIDVEALEKKENACKNKNSKSNNDNSINN